MVQMFVELKSFIVFCNDKNGCILQKKNILTCISKPGFTINSDQSVRFVRLSVKVQTPFEFNFQSLLPELTCRLVVTCKIVDGKRDLPSTNTVNSTVLFVKTCSFQSVKKKKKTLLFPVTIFLMVLFSKCEPFISYFSLFKYVFKVLQGTSLVT